MYLGLVLTATIVGTCQAVVSTKTPFVPDFHTGVPAGPGSHFAIFPGTKWCGADNIASSYEDLGVHNETDACCRTHDHCPYYIDRWQNRYHLSNPYPWTVSHCNCDTGLYNCLKNVSSDAASEVGKLFFGLLDVHCFKFEYGQYCAKHSLGGLVCEQKATGLKGVSTKFPHTWSVLG
ncbi:hypothetical protein ScPMuIL_011537 [Solemya velum]